MALNKAHTSVWVKTLIIILIVAFVSLFMYNGILGVFALFQSNTDQTTASSSTATDPVAAASAQFQPQVDALKKVAVSNPTSYTAAINVANSYFDWANTLSTPAAGQSQISTAAMAAAGEQWMNAKQAYDAAAKLMKTFDPAAETDRSFATFYSNETTAAIDIAKSVTQKAPTFAQGWFHLGYFYDNLNQGKLALPAYEKYLQLDPKGQNAALAQQRIKALGGSVSATGTK